jgi:hypothetical protein
MNYIAARFVALAATASATILAQAQTFQQTDWPGGSTTDFLAATNVSGQTAISESSGGNPGSYVQLSVTDGVGTSYGVYGQFVNSWVYDPSVSGAISTINASADVNGKYNPGYSFVLLMKQAGTVYAAIGNGSTVNGWGNSALPFALNQFYTGQVVNADGSRSNLGALNVSVTGAPIQFGYGFIVGSPVSLTVTDTDYVGIDNVKVFVNPVPEPATLGLGALLGGAFLRRRKTN